MEQDAINLTLVHEWMTVDDAQLLLIDAYRKFKPREKYGGNTVVTLMKITFGAWQRLSEDEMRAELELVKSFKCLRDHENGNTN